jgi:endonuclease/exonuclease/phosphatase (EEP) superfamily protein YafD
MIATMMGVLALLMSAVSWPSLVCRALGGKPPRPRPQLAALAPAATIPAVAAVPVAAARSWRLALALAAPAAVLVCWQLPPRRVGAGPGDERTWRELRVLTVNTEGGNAEAEHLVALLADHRADVLIAQEVTPEAVARLDKAGLRDRLPYGVIDAQPRYSGTAIWARWPLRAAAPIAGLSSAAPRAVLHLGGQPVTFAGVHVMAPLHHNEPRWGDELKLLAARQASGAGPEVLAGDFNATRDHRLFRDLLAAGYLDSADAAWQRRWPAVTWPAGHRGRPVMRLDHVLVSQNDFSVRGSCTVSVPGTDHRGVLAVLRLRERSGNGR